MHAMAAGELDDKVEISGHDEVAEMATALEGFRLSSLDAQRLSLVEKLAEELQEKNQKLEQAQEQIVMREKLAALGELTAGVAHEIKNPLNFVKNFAEGSIELLEELKEVVSENGGKGLGEKQRKLLGEINEDLNENLSSILRNGERANRIVQDMLGMGRGSGDFQQVEINTLVMEHVKLAYHAARATNPDFQLTIKEELDPNMGELNVIPHDLGRVFLNMVNNACYATDEKRKQVEEETGAKLKAGEGYEPTVKITTRRDEENVVIAIHDNGIGIPKKLVDSIFNPFFTTKPPDKGTGLGLALSNDIVVKHGGSIEVDTEQDEYTEMSVSLPVQFAPANAEEKEKAEKAEKEETEGEEPPAPTLVASGNDGKDSQPPEKPAAERKVARKAG